MKNKIIILKLLLQNLLVNQFMVIKIMKNENEIRTLYTISDEIIPMNKIDKKK
jgi:hypothetical protein